MLPAFVVYHPADFVIGNVVVKGLPVVTAKFLVSDIPNSAAADELSSDCETLRKYDPTAECDDEAVVEKAQPGMGPAVVGTLITTGLASLFAIPLGILAAIYLNEYGKQTKLARFIRFMTDVMTGVPSIVMGIFIYQLWIVKFGNNRSALAAALALACLMLPIVVRSSEEMLRLVPNTLREASAGLGSRTWKTTLRVVLPALPGLVPVDAGGGPRRRRSRPGPVHHRGTTHWQPPRPSPGRARRLVQIYSMITNGGNPPDGVCVHPHRHRVDPDQHRPKSVPVRDAETDPMTDEETPCRSRRLKTFRISSTPGRRGPDDPTHPTVFNVRTSVLYGGFRR